MMGGGTSLSAAETAEVIRQARETAPDDYLAATLAPLAVRSDYLTLAAFFGEIARIPLQVSEPGLGEIRLQWWHDALFAAARTGHPVADALSELTARGAVAAPLLLTAIEARSAELYPEPFASRDAFDAYLAATETTHLKARVAIAAAAGLDIPPPDLIDRAGAVWSACRFLVRLPHLLARGRCPLPGSDLAPPDPDPNNTVHNSEADLRRAVGARVAEATGHFAALRPELKRISRDGRVPLVAVALAGPYLRALRRAGHDPLRDVVEIAPLRRLTRLWLAARFARF